MRPPGELGRLVAPEYRRNFLAFTGDILAFGVAMSFISRSTVLPSLVRRLTGSAPLVGLVETVCNGAWLMPQLLAARFLMTRSPRKRYILRAAVAQRSLFLMVAPLLLLLAPAHPGAAAAVLFVALGLFHCLDAFGSVAWFDLLTLAIPPVPRARMIGLAQLLCGVAGMACGLLVSRVLGSGRMGWVSGYSLLFLLAGLSLAAGLGALLSMREHPARATVASPPMASFLRDLAGHLRTDGRLRLVVAVRLLVGSSGMAAPFYILYALDGLGLGPQSIGLFTAANLAGGIVSSLVMARLAARRGTPAVIRLTSALALASPVLALLTLGPVSRLDARILPIVYGSVFVALGALSNGGFAGFMSYLLVFAPEQHRTVYVGLANTLNGAVLVLPFVGGWILKASSYGVLFAATAVVTSLGLAGSFRLKEPRRAAGARS